MIRCLGNSQANLTVMIMPTELTRIMSVDTSELQLGARQDCRKLTDHYCVQALPDCSLLCAIWMSRLC